MIPMFTSTNLFLRMVKSASLRRRLKKGTPPAVAGGVPPIAQDSDRGADPLGKTQ